MDPACTAFSKPLPEFLVQDSDGTLRFAEHRIGVQDVIPFYQDGYSAEMLAASYPSLPLPLIHRFIAFYLENQSEFDAYVAAYDAETARQRATAPSALVESLRERLRRAQAG